MPGKKLFLLFTCFATSSDLKTFHLSKIIPLRTINTHVSEYNFHSQERQCPLNRARTRQSKATPLTRTRKINLFSEDLLIRQQRKKAAWPQNYILYSTILEVMR